MANFHIVNFGCRATQADGAGIERQLAGMGWTGQESHHGAEVVVLNTCTVTESADKDARAAIRRIHRENPQARIVVTGCYAQRAPEELARLEGVTRVVGNSHKHLVAQAAADTFSPVVAGGFVPLDALGSLTPKWDPLVGDIFAHTELLAAPVFDASSFDPSSGAGGGRTRPNLKVQDGCNNRCSFCVIPFVRGRSRSLNLDEVLREVRQIEAAGHRELVLSGINLGRWGRDFSPQLRLEDLIRALLQHTGIEKLRLSSVEPMDWSDELIERMAGEPRIACHAHLPLQSGCDATLRRMRRKYRPWHYAEKVERIRRLIPDAAIGADVMTGFPGESDAEFEQSRSLIAGLPFTYLHVFTYSSRPGTPSTAMAAQVPVQVARERNQVLRELAAEKNRRFREGFRGRTLEAITLGRGHDGATESLTDNYMPLTVSGPALPANRLIRATITDLDDSGLTGEVLSVR